LGERSTPKAEGEGCFGICPAQEKFLDMYFYLKINKLETIAKRSKHPSSSAFGVDFSHKGRSKKPASIYIIE
jgi:hypothetical protein